MLCVDGIGQARAAERSRDFGIADDRTLAGACSAHGGAGCRIGRKWRRDRDRGRRRHGEVTADRRVRATGRHARRTRRDRRVPGVRQQYKLLRLARHLAHAVRCRRCIALRGQNPQCRGGACGHRSRTGRSRAASLRSAQRPDRGQRSHRFIRCEAPQDLAGDVACRLPSCPDPRGAPGCRARGLPLARSAVTGFVAGAGACPAGTQVPLRGCLPAREGARRRARPREAEALSGGRGPSSTPRKRRT